jgi:hypothetical protein
MARLRFIQGAITGKLGEFVGSRWKGINYIKTFTAPSNPRTADQISIRKVFLAISWFATALFSKGLLAFIPPARRMTERNSVFKANRQMLHDKVFTPANLQVSRSNLNAPIQSLGCVANSSTSKFTIDGGFALPNDVTETKLHLIIYDHVKGLYVKGVSKSISNTTPIFAENLNFPVDFGTPEGSQKANCYCYAFISAVSANNKLLISQTVSATVA